jgi:transcription antitermination factor NusG
VSSSDLASRHWVAVRVKSNFEHYVSSSIKGKNLEEFYPTYVLKRQDDRHSEVRAPLFPGYLFCRLDYQQRFPVLKIPGVVGFVGAGKQPLPVKEEEISEVRRIVESRLPVWPCPFLCVGQRIRLKAGPLCGIEGSILSVTGAWQIVVTVTFLQRSVAVNVNPAWIEPIANVVGSALCKTEYRCFQPPVSR